MQDIIMYATADGVLAKVKDFVNVKSLAAPSLVRGIGATLKIRIFASGNGIEQYPVAAFSGLSLKWYMDSDFDQQSAPKIAVESGITTASITDIIDGTERAYTQVSIPIAGMDGDALAQWLGTDEVKSGLHGELVGYDSDSDAAFILQIKDFSVRNRIYVGEPPEPTQSYQLTSSPNPSFVQLVQSPAALTRLDDTSLGEPVYVCRSWCRNTSTSVDYDVWLWKSTAQDDDTDYWVCAVTANDSPSPVAETFVKTGKEGWSTTLTGTYTRAMPNIMSTTPTVAEAE